MFRNIQQYSTILRPSLPFLKIIKSPLILKKGPDCVHLWIKFSIQNELKFPTVSLRHLFFCVFDEIFSKCPSAPALRHYSFCKTFHLKYLTVYWICLSQLLLSNLNIDLMLCIALDTFRILTHSELCFFRYMQRYSSIFSIIKAYSGLCRTTLKTLCNACICSNLVYLESWNIQNLFIIASRGTFRTLIYLRK